MGDEHGDLRPVLRLVKHLLQVVLGGFEGDLRLGKKIAFPSRGVEAIERGRLDKGLEAEEAVAQIGTALGMARQSAWERFSGEE